MLIDTGREGTRRIAHRVNALPAVPTPSIPTPTIGAPEGLRGSLEGSVDIDSIDSLDSFDDAIEFSQQAYDRFKQGYKSLYQELSFWVEDDAIEGVLHVTLVASIAVCWLVAPRSYNVVDWSILAITLMLRTVCLLYSPHVSSASWQCVQLAMPCLVSAVTAGGLLLSQLNTNIILNLPSCCCYWFSCCCSSSDY